MLKDNILFVILLAVVGVIALTINYIISTQELQDEAKKERLKWLQQQSEHLFHALTILRELDCKEAIVDKLDEHAMALLEEISLLAPDSELLEKMAELKDTADSALPTTRTLDSDRNLKRAQIYINFSEKMIISLAKGGRLTTTLAKSYQQELYWLKTTMVVDAHLHQGERFLAAADKLTALSHFKHAKAVLMRANIPPHYKASRMSRINGEVEKLQPKRTKYQGTLAESIDRLL